MIKASLKASLPVSALTAAGGAVVAVVNTGANVITPVTVSAAQGAAYSLQIFVTTSVSTVVQVVSSGVMG